MRVRLGPKFSAGAAMLWNLKERLELTNAALANVIGCKASQVSKILWGDISPTVPQTGKIEALTQKHKPVIRAGHWSEAAPADWEPPPVVEARAALDHLDTPLTDSTADNTIPMPPSFDVVEGEDTESTDAA